MATPVLVQVHTNARSTETTLGSHGSTTPQGLAALFWKHNTNLILSTSRFVCFLNTYVGVSLVLIFLTNTFKLYHPKFIPYEQIAKNSQKQR